MNTLHADPDVRLAGARALAWALLLSGWIGLAGLAQVHTATVVHGQALLALWLFTLGTWTVLLDRWRPGTACRRMLLLAAAALVVAALSPGWRHALGSANLVIGAVALALVVALASGTVRACRFAGAARLGPPFASAVAGALLAWVLVGDLGDASALAARLGAGVGVAALVLAWLHPAGRDDRTRTGGHAALFDCSLPNGDALVWQRPREWPTWLASLVMLPMMCSLPWMSGLCRGTPVSPQIMLGLHLAAMFVPAWLLSTWGDASVLRASVWACGPLLLLGALALLWIPVSASWVVLALSHGSAWSLAWAWRLGVSPPALRARRPLPMRAAAFNAAWALALGLAVGAGGLQVLGTLHVAFGAAGALAGAAALFCHLLGQYERRGRAGSRGRAARRQSSVPRCTSH